MKADPGGGWKASLLAGLGGIALGAAAVAFYHAWGGGKAATEAVVRNYILDHGEILPQAMERLQQRESAAIVAQHRAALETPYHGAWAGNPNGDVVLVEFFDYACPYCHAINADVDRLLHRVEKRRGFPTRVVQYVQRLAQDRIFAPVLQPGKPIRDVHWAVRLIDRTPLLQDIPAHFVGLGVRRERVRSPNAYA